MRLKVYKTMLYNARPEGMQTGLQVMVLYSQIAQTDGRTKVKAIESEFEVVDD